MNLFGLDPEALEHARMHQEAEARENQHKMDEFLENLSTEQMVVIHRLFYAAADEKTGTSMATMFYGQLNSYLRYVRKVDPYTGLTEEEQFAKVAEESRESS
jgi:hypothetical protein